MNLLPSELLIQTSEVDHADWNYRKALGWIQRLRFRMVIALLQERNFTDLLEIGYGSGILMPELQRHCERIFGLDPHDKHQQVTAQLARANLQAELHSGSAEVMPFEDDQFDCVVSVSAMEYVPDIHKACAELRRVVRPGGSIVIVTPGQSRLLDIGLKLLTSEDADQNYGDRRQSLAPALLQHFTLDKLIKRPLLTAWLVPLYHGYRLVNQK